MNPEAPKTLTELSKIAGEIRNPAGFPGQTKDLVERLARGNRNFFIEKITPPAVSENYIESKIVQADNLTTLTLMVQSGQDEKRKKISAYLFGQAGNDVELTCKQTVAWLVFPEQEVLRNELIEKMTEVCEGHPLPYGTPTNEWTKPLASGWLPLDGVLTAALQKMAKKETAEPTRTDLEGSVISDLYDHLGRPLEFEKIEYGGKLTIKLVKPIVPLESKDYDISSTHSFNNMAVCQQAFIAPANQIQLF